MGHASDQWQSRKETGSLVLQDNVAYSFGLALLGCCCCLFLVLIRLLHFYDSGKGQNISDFFHCVCEQVNFKINKIKLL